MWKALNIPSMLRRIVLLLEEQNQLLRELHLAQTGSHARTARRAATSLTPTRVRTSADVFQRTPLTEDEQRMRENAASEHAASAPVDPSSEGDILNPITGSGAQGDQKLTPTVVGHFGGPESSRPRK